MKKNNQTNQLLNNALTQKNPRLKEELLVKWALLCQNQGNFEINYNELPTKKMVYLLAFVDALLLGDIFPEYNEELQKIVCYLENNKELNYNREQQFYPTRIKQRIGELQTI